MYKSYLRGHRWPLQLSCVGRRRRRPYIYIYIYEYLSIYLSIDRSIYIYIYRTCAGTADTDGFSNLFVWVAATAGRDGGWRAEVGRGRAPAAGASAAAGGPASNTWGEG